MAMLPVSARAFSNSWTLATAPPGSLHILIAEDGPDMGDLLSGYLIGDGHTIELEANGRAALTRIRSDGFDLVLTDRGMPHLSGDQLVEAIRETSDVPIIMITGFGGMMMAAGERPPGVDFILSKPVAIVALRHRPKRQRGHGDLGGGPVRPGSSGHQHANHDRHRVSTPTIVGTP